MFSKREAFLLAAAAMAVSATLMVVWSRLTLDDAYITFRYARHLAEGYGLGAWNHTGEHVEGYSSLLWTLLLAGAARFGIDVRGASKVLGAAAGIVVIAALVRRSEDRPAFLAGLFLAVYVPFVLYATSGMEAVAFTSLVTLMLVGPGAWQPIVAPLLVAMRPEGVLVAGIDVLALAWRREHRRRIVATALAGGLALTAIAIHRWATYDALAPNTYYAKVAGGGVGHVKLGLVYVGGWMLAHAVVVAFLAIGAVTVRRAGDRHGVTYLALFVAYILYMAIAGGRSAECIPRLAPIRPRGPRRGTPGNDRSHERRTPMSMEAGRCRRRTGACGQRRRPSRARTRGASTGKRGLFRLARVAGEAHDDDLQQLRRRAPVSRGRCSYRRAWIEHALHRPARHIRSRRPPGFQDRHGLGD